MLELGVDLTKTEPTTNQFADFCRQRSQVGQGMVEYALILFFVTLVTVAILLLVSLATQRVMGLACGALGCKKEVRTAQNYIIFDDNPPRCGRASGHLLIYAQFFTDIPSLADISGATDTGIPLTLYPNTLAGAGSGNVYISNILPEGSSCPVSIVLQSSPSTGGGTVAYPVIHQDWP
jgi:hypothetical protein